MQDLIFAVETRMGHRRFTVDVAGPELATRDELRELQLERLRATLVRVYERVPHYRAKFDAAGVHPRELRSLGDLARFPFTTKDDLRANYPFGMFAVPLRKVVRIHASSGTTGRPTVVGYTQRDIDTWADVMARSLRTAGACETDVVHVAFGYGLFTGGLGVHYGAERLGATVVPVSGGQTERQVQLIRDFSPTVLMSTPSYALAIADEFERQGLDPRDTTLRLGLFGAEPHQAALLYEYWAIPIVALLLLFYYRVRDDARVVPIAVVALLVNWTYLRDPLNTRLQDAIVPAAPFAPVRGTRSMTTAQPIPVPAVT